MNQPSAPFRPAEDLDDFTRRIRAARRRAGLTQSQVCDRKREICGTPLSAGTISRWERGERPTDIRDVVAVECALGLHAGTLTRPLGFMPITEDLLRATELYTLLSSQAAQALLPPPSPATPQP